MKVNEFETKSLSRLSLKYIIPSIFGMLFVCMQSMIDGMFIGNFVGENALASITINAPLMQIVNAMVLVIAIGGQSLASIKMGEKNEKGAQNVFTTSLIALLVVSVFVVIIGSTLARPLVQLLGANEALIDNSADYLFSICFFIPCLAVWFLCDFTLRILGKPFISFLAMAAAACTNIALDYVFIKVLGKGVSGAGLATGISFAVGLCISIVPFLSKNSKVKFFRGKFRWKYLKRLTYNGSSEGVNSVAGAIVALAFNVTLMKYAGEKGIAAYTAILYIMQIGFCFMIGVSDGMRPMIGYNYGAKNIKRIKKILTLECSLSAGAGLVVFLIMFFAGGEISKIFVSSPDLIAMTSQGSKIVAFAFVISWINIVASGFYTAIDFAKESVIIALMRGLVFSLLGIFVLPLLFGIKGVWATMIFSETLTFVCVTIMVCVQYKKGKILHVAPPLQNDATTKKLNVDRLDKNID